MNVDLSTTNDIENDLWQFIAGYRSPEDRDITLDKNGLNS